MFTSFLKSKNSFKLNTCHVNSYNMQVILTDGDASTLANMKENMELNNLYIKPEDSEELKESKNKVCYFACIIQSVVCRCSLLHNLTCNSST
jgi:hypothetical protein